MSIKKFFTVAALITFTAGVAFSDNFFAKRFYEVRFGAEAGFSNNLLAANELLQKELVIDLPTLYAECPKNGMTFIATANPSSEMNVNVLGVTVGVKTGIDVYEKMNFERGFFEFLGKGNTLGEPLSFGFTNDTDIFAYSQLNVGFKVWKFMVYAQPSVFLPVLSIRNSGGVLTVQNDEDGSIHAALDANFNIFSGFTLTQYDADSGSYKMNNIGADTIDEAIASGYGFDLGGTMRLPLGRDLSIDAVARIPMIPGKLNSHASYSAGFTYDAESIMGLTDAEMETSSGGFGASESETLYINRPLKAAVYVNQNILGTLLTLRGGAGFGVQRPFSDSFYIYPEYYLGAELNLADVMKFNVSTQYRDQLFIHQMGGTVNIRLIQVDAGVSVQSANFIKSCQGAGFGAYTYFTLGF